MSAHWSATDELQTRRLPVRWARTPFYFNSAEHLLRIERERASNLGELLDAVKSCSEESIFQHTFRTLQEHHFIRQGYSNDFAHWASFACQETALAERLSSVDVRKFTSVRALREKIVDTLSEYLSSCPAARDRTAAEPFFFCSSVSVIVPPPFVARNLAEFTRALERISIHCIYYHFIEARQRLKLGSNDFSIWLGEQMGLKRAAELIDRIDIYSATLQGVRHRILQIAETVQA